MQDVSGMFHKREIGVRNDTYTRAEIDAKDASVRSAADKAQATADGAVEVNNTQNTQISALQKSAHSHSNKDVLDKTEQPYTTAERDKLAGLENYVHPAHNAYNKGMYKFAADDGGHVTEAEMVTKSDITALGVPGENTTYEITRKGNRIYLEGSDGSSSSAMTNDYVIHGAEKGYDVDPYKCYLIFYSRKPEDDDAKVPYLRSSEEIWVNKDHSGIGVKGTITAESFSGANATNQKQGLMSPEDKANVDANTAARHTHANKPILDQLNEEQWKIINGAANKAHVHDNKDTLDKITQEEWTAINSAKNKAHTHDNKATLDKIDDVSWLTVYGQTHEHSNKDVLDKITASYTTEEKTKLKGIADGAEVNQNAFSTIASGSARYTATSKTAAFVIEGEDGTSVTLSTNGRATISSHSHSNKAVLDATTASYTTAEQTKLKGVSAGAEVNQNAFSTIATGSARYAATAKQSAFLIDGDGGTSVSLDTKTGRLTVSSHTHDNKAVLDKTTASYTAADKKKLDGMDAMITDSAVQITGANNAAKWYRLGVLVSSANFASAVIRVWSGDGANGLANQNASFEIQIKDGWQPTESATKACGVTVYRINCSSVKVKVIPTAHDTYTVWTYLPWTYWNGNYAVYGKYKSWTSQKLIQSYEPEGTAADTAYYDQAFLTSTVAKATEATTLTDSGWQKPTFPSGVKSSSIRYRKQGKIVSVTGYVQFSAEQTTITVFTLPTGYRPPAKIQQFNAVDSSAQQSFLIKIDTDGKVGFFGKTRDFFATSFEYYMHCTFFVD